MDVIELGKPGREPRPPRPPRRGWPYGVAALVALAVVAYLGTRPEAPPRPVASPSASPSVVTPVEVVEETPSPEPPIPDPGFAGTWEATSPRERTGLLLATGGASMVEVYDADTGKVSYLGPPDHTIGWTQAIAQIDGGWLIGAHPICPDTCNGQFYAIRGRDPVLVGEGSNAFLDPDGRSVWVVAYEEEKFDSAEYLEHWTLTGSRIGSRMPLRRNESVSGITSEGPLLDNGLRGGATLVDFPAQRRTPVLAGRVPVGVNGHMVATQPTACFADMPGDCTLRVANLRTGRSRRVVTLDGPVLNVRIDPAARYVALRIDNDGQAIRVYDVAAHREVTIGGLESPPMATSLCWSPDGRWLVFTHPNADAEGYPEEGTQVAVWRPGLSRPFLLGDLPGRDLADVMVGTAR